MALKDGLWQQSGFEWFVIFQSPLRHALQDIALTLHSELLCNASHCILPSSTDHRASRPPLCSSLRTFALPCRQLPARAHMPSCPTSGPADFLFSTRDRARNRRPAVQFFSFLVAFLSYIRDSIVGMNRAFPVRKSRGTWQTRASCTLSGMYFARRSHAPFMSLLKQSLQRQQFNNVTIRTLKGGSVQRTRGVG